MDADVVIVGAGIAGALVAARLAEVGVKVIIVEAGPRVERSTAVLQYYNALIKVPECAYPNTDYAPHPRSDNLDDYYVQMGPQKFSSTYLRQVGGTTWHWLGTCLRLVPDDFRLATRFGRGVDWPIGYDALERWYGEAESEIGVSGDSRADLGSPRSTPYPMLAIPMSVVDQHIANARSETSKLPEHAEFAGACELKNVVASGISSLVLRELPSIGDFPQLSKYVVVGK